MIKAVVVLLGTLLLIHDHAASELDSWYKSLRAVNGTYCCDGSDAASVLDPDWDTNADLEWPYRVKLKYSDGTKSDWVKVHRDLIVKDNNRAGIAKVWPIFERNGWFIRCFLPGSLT